MKIFDVIILTDNRYLNNNSNNHYITNVIKEDNYVIKALEELNLKVKRLSWDDENFDWNTTKTILFRSTWDYSERFPKFSNWLNSVSKQTLLLNSEKLIRWNIDKHYLLDLQKSGVNICKSFFIEKNDPRTLQELVKTFNLNEFVVKPCISAGARHTYKINSSNINEYQNYTLNS